MSRGAKLFGCGVCLVVLIAAMSAIGDPAGQRRTQPLHANAIGLLSAATVDAAAANVKSSKSVYFDVALTARAVRDAEDTIHKALEKPITVDFQETPLKDAVAHVGSLCGIPVHLNAVELKEEGIALDARITLAIQIPLEARLVFKLMLNPIGLRTFLFDEALQIAPELCDGRYRTQLFSAATLLEGGIPIDRIAAVIQRETRGPWAKIDGTGGTILIFGRAMIVRHNEHVLVETADLLDVLERIVAGSETSGTVPLHLSSEHRRVHEALARKVSFRFRDTPLKDAAEFLARLAQVNVLLNEASLSEVRIPTDEPVTLEVENLTLTTAFNQLLEPLGLDFVIQDGVIKIMQAVTLEEKLVSVVFNLRDFSTAGYCLNSIVEAIQSETSGPWQEIDGTGGDIDDLLPGLLIVRQTRKNIEEAALFIDDLRSTLKKHSPDGKLPNSSGPPCDQDGLKVLQYRINSRTVREVRDAMLKLVAQDSWKSNGGKGDLAIVDTMIIVRQTREVHRQIDKFLHSLGEHSTGVTSSGIGFFSVD